MVNGKVSKAQLKSIDVTIGLLKRLSSKERVVLALYYYENLSPAEIAAVLQQPEASIQEQLEQIHAKILDLIQAEGTQDVQPRRMAAQAL